MAKADAERIRDRYEKAKTAWDQHQKKARAKRRREKDQADAQRKTLAGELLLHLVDTNQYQRSAFLAQLDAYLTDDRQRALFDLPSQNGPSGPADPNGEADSAQETPNRPLL